MIFQIMTVHDSAAMAYLPPMHYQSIGTALRAFKDAANDRTQAIANHPKDYTLFHLGSYNDQTATFDLFKTGNALAKALDLIESSEVEPPLFKEMSQ